MIDNVLVWIPTLVILAYIPVLIYLDMKFREVEHSTWWWMVGFCSPCVFILYYAGIYPPILLGLSLAAVGLYFIAMKVGLFEGADFMFLMFISLFFVQNPKSGLVLMPVSFGIFLLATILSISLMSYVFHLKDTEYYKTFPMMPAISVAFILTLVLA